MCHRIDIDKEDQRREALIYTAIALAFVLAIAPVLVAINATRITDKDFRPYIGQSKNHDK